MRHGDMTSVGSFSLCSKVVIPLRLEIAALCVHYYSCSLSVLRFILVDDVSLFSLFSFRMLASKAATMRIVMFIEFGKR